MKTRIAAIATAIALGVAPISSALAFDASARYAPHPFHDVDTTGSLTDHAMPPVVGCPMSSAAEGNANQQTRPVMQYGQTAGGVRC